MRMVILSCDIQVAEFAVTFALWCCIRAQEGSCAYVSVKLQILLVWMKNWCCLGNFHLQHSHWIP